MDDPYVFAWVRLIDRAKYFRLLPWPVKRFVGTLAGRNSSFLIGHRQQILDNLQTCLGLDRCAADENFRLLCESTGIAAQMVWHLPHVSTTWLKNNIETTSDAILQEIKNNGGIIFSHHSYHHNLLISYYKTLGIRCYPVGNPPTAFSDDDYLYRFTLYLNEATETNLTGGCFVYNDNKKKLVAKTKECLSKRQIMIVFCDFNEVKPVNPVYGFLGKTLQIPGGVIRSIERNDTPVYFAGFHWQQSGKYSLSMERLRPAPEGAEADTLGQRYITVLERYIRQNPSAWQGWDGF